MKNNQERTCVICRTKIPKSDLLRFIVKDGQAILDKNQKSLGRGFYICSERCWDAGVGKKKKIKVSSQGNKFISLPARMFRDIGNN